MRLKIRHNMEMAHRLLNDTGKCQNIHGHGMQVELVLLSLASHQDGMAVNRYGEVLEFGAMKKAFRQYIDSTYDHRLVLNRADPFAGPIYQMAEIKTQTDGLDLDKLHVKLTNEQVWLPGLSLVDGDPTVENLCRWIAKWAASYFRCDVVCRIDETQTNGAEVMASYSGYGVNIRD